MATFRCSRFPSGTAHIRTGEGIVHFRDGKAEVDDPAVAKALLDVPAVFGISGDAPREPESESESESEGVEADNDTSETPLDDLDKEALLELARDRDIEVDGRWSTKRIAAAIREHQ